jgi:hypothetical protein
MTAWVRGGNLDKASFAGLFFGREAGDPVVEKLRAAALSAAQATSHADLRDAARNL